MFKAWSPKVLVPFVAALFLAPGARSQGTVQYHIVQAVVDSLRSPGQCGQIDLYLRAQPDVIVARMDYNTRNIMLQVPSSSAIDRQWLSDRFASLGLKIRCFRRYPLQSALYSPLDPRNCVDEIQVIDR